MTTKCRLCPQQVLPVPDKSAPLVYLRRKPTKDHPKGPILNVGWPWIQPSHGLCYYHGMKAKGWFAPVVHKQGKRRFNDVWIR